MDNKSFMITLLLILFVGLAHASLVAEYHFEGNESIALDTSGNNNDCTINNASKVAGVQGYGLSFNGFDSYLDCGNDVSLNFGTGNYTIMAWIKTSYTNPAKNNWILDKGDGEIGVSLFASGDIEGDEADFQGGYGANYDAYGSSFITDGDWHLITGVYDTSNDTAYIYVDGVLENTVEGTGDNVNVLDNLQIGVEHDGNQYWNGTMDEVRLYNEALSPTFISEVYEDEKPHIDYTIFDLSFMVFDVIGNVLQGLITNIPSLINTVLYLFMFSILFSAIGVILMLATKMKPKI